MSHLKPVLYAEDDENDVYLMERSFSSAQIPNPLRIASDGKQMVAYLAGNPPYDDRLGNPLPCLVLMDLSMPGKHGLDILSWMKTEPGLQTLPVVVFSSSNQERDIQRAYSLGANGYIIKPGDIPTWQRIAQTLKEYWLADNRPSVTFREFTPLNVRP